MMIGACVGFDAMKHSTRQSRIFLFTLPPLNFLLHLHLSLSGFFVVVVLTVVVVDDDVVLLDVEEVLLLEDVVVVIVVVVLILY